MDAELHLSLAESRGTIDNDARNAPPEWPLGSYLVFLAQPYRANVQALFERQIYPDRRTAAGAAERPYDVAGLDAADADGRRDVPRRAAYASRERERRLTLVADEYGVRRDLGLDTGVRSGRARRRTVTDADRPADSESD